MSLTENGNGMVMPVGPMYGNGGGFGGFGGDGWWVILFLFALMGNNGWGGFGGGNAGEIYPWMNQANQVNGGFRDQMINDNINSVKDGVYGSISRLSSQIAVVRTDLASRTSAQISQERTVLIALLYLMEFAIFLLIRIRTLSASSIRCARTRSMLRMRRLLILRDSLLQLISQHLRALRLLVSLRITQLRLLRLNSILTLLPYPLMW